MHKNGIRRGQTDWRCAVKDNKRNAHDPVRWASDSEYAEIRRQRNNRSYLVRGWKVRRLRLLAQERASVISQLENLEGQ